MGLQQQDEHKGKEFAHRLLNDPDFRDNLQQKLMKLFLAY